MAASESSGASLGLTGTQSKSPQPEALSVIECQCDSDPRATGGPAPGSRAQRGRLEVNSDVPDAGVPATTTVRSASVAHRDVRRLMVPAHVQHSGVPLRSAQAQKGLGSKGLQVRA